MVLETIKKGLETYVNVYVPKENKNEKFKDNGKKEETNGFSIIYNIIWWIVIGFAIYLSFRCNGKFMLGDFLLAFICAPCYIIYHLAMTGLCGLI
jgi:hypothetical protein